jgi:hypothetical protein
LSLATGGLAVVVLAAWRHFESLRGTFSNYVLMAADSIGLVAKPSAEVSDAITTPGLLSLNDSKAMAVLVFLGVTLALASVLLSLRAQSKAEPSLYLGAGFACGSSSLIFVNYYASLLAILIGGAALVAVRRWRQA